MTAREELRDLQEKLVKQEKLEKVDLTVSEDKRVRVESRGSLGPKDIRD